MSGSRFREGNISMAKINTNYKKLKNKAQTIESKLYDAGGIISQSNVLKKEMDSLSKEWVDKNHYSHLNAISKEYSTLVEYARLLEKFRKLLTDASTEYEKARNESVNIGKSI